MNICNSRIIFVAVCAVGLAGSGRVLGEEHEFGSVPVSIHRAAPDILKLSWEGIIGRSYDIEQNSKLSDVCCWTKADTVESVDEETVRRSVVMDEATGFFRVRLLPSIQFSSSTQNLVANGTFEHMTGSLPTDWLQGGYGTNSRMFTYPVAGNGGSASAARLTITNHQSGDAKWYPKEIPVIAGNTYRFSDWYVSTVEANVTLRFNYGGTYVYEWKVSPPASASWRQVAFNFTVPSGVTSMTVFHALTQNGMLTTDDMSITPAVLSEGLISFDFDDGWDTSCEFAASVLEGAGYRGTFYIITSRVGRETVLTTNQVQALRLAGHEIAGHTLGHTNLTNMTLVAAEREINLCRSTLQSWGVGPITAFAYPFGGHDTAIRQKVKEAGYVCAFGTDGGLNSRSSYDRYAFLRVSIGSQMSLADVTSRIDAALARKEWLILLFHHIKEGANNSQTITPEFFRSIVEYVQSKNAKVVTATQGYNHFK